MRSDTIKRGVARAPARARLRGAGFTAAELEKPIIGIANTWTEVTPWSSLLRELAASVKERVHAARGTPIEFNTIAVSNGIMMGTDGMRGSLVSREVVAGHVAPEAALGGPIAFVRDGDSITFDVAARRLDFDADIEARRRETPPLAPRPSRRARGVVAKYAALVSSASEGAVTRPWPNDLHEGERR